jgi:uncharacterized protein YndB with AHSA1/START domain
MKDENKLTITRVFDAPKELVFKAWTEPEQIKKWWGPKGFSAPVIKVNLKKGGKYLYAMKDEKGKVYWTGGEYLEVDAPRRLVVTDYFADEKGNKVDPVKYGIPKDFPKESTVTVKFDEEKGKTKLSIIYDLPVAAAARDAMKKSRMDEGWNSSLDKLAEAVEG